MSGVTQSQSDWTIQSIIDEYSATCIANEMAREEGKPTVPTKKWLSRRKIAFLSQELLREIKATCDGVDNLGMADQSIALSCDTNNPFFEDAPYLICAAAILDALGVKEGEDFEGGCSWEEEAFEAMATGPGLDPDYYRHWYYGTTGAPSFLNEQERAEMT
ncbi:hypothetical protein OAE87_01120 [bacterium]|nr:hypothetical protein [bacterium]